MIKCGLKIPLPISICCCNLVALSSLGLELARMLNPQSLLPGDIGSDPSLHKISLIIIYIVVV